MFQHNQMSRLRNWGAGAGNNAWLAILVGTFEKISQADLRAVPCDGHVLAAFKAHLARPTPPRGCRGPDSRRLH